MKSPTLLIDANYLCHRAFHALGELAYDGAGTGTIFGVLRDIIQLQDTFSTSKCVFAFDSKGPGLRHKILPTYKSSRRERYQEESDEERAARNDFHEQIGLLRSRYLPSAGFRNVFSADGFEADDIIASLAARAPAQEEMVIISSDQDLWQCLRPNVWCWNPHKKKGYDMHAFVKEWRLEPKQWRDVKAYAGCSTDDVPGVPGVGEATAAKWLRGELNDTTKTAQKLDAAGELYLRNIQVVRLPFPGTPLFNIEPDEVTEASWRSLADHLGMKSLRNTAPRMATHETRGRKRDRQEGFGLDGEG